MNGMGEQVDNDCADNVSWMCGPPELLARNCVDLIAFALYRSKFEHSHFQRDQLPAWISQLSSASAKQLTAYAVDRVSHGEGITAVACTAYCMLRGLYSILYGQRQMCAELRPAKLTS